MPTRLADFFKRQPWMLAFLVLICLWEAVSYWHLLGRTLLASPAEVWHVLSVSTLSRGGLRQSVYLNAFYTFRRALIGWSIALLAGSALGLVTGSIEALFIGTEPIIEFTRVIPPVLALPLFLVAFNYGEPAYTWTIVFGCFPMMSLAVARGVQSISREKMELLSAYRVSGPVRAFAVVMEILPSVFLGARLTLTMALIVTVVTEMVFTPNNGWALGALARDSEISFDTPRFYGCVVVVALFGYLANVGIRKFEERLGVGSSAETRVGTQA
jgi:ABC-type nitrate/sulfonate/bicarbonate transport system permease component